MLVSFEISYSWFADGLFSLSSYGPFYVCVWVLISFAYRTTSHFRIRTTHMIHLTIITILKVPYRNIIKFRGTRE